MCACKPLCTEELLYAIRVKLDRDAKFTSEITEPYLLALCDNLLVLDSQRKVQRFSHLSVTEYIEDSYGNCLALSVVYPKASFVIPFPETNSISKRPPAQL
jgi:hypothetical protein